METFQKINGLLKEAEVYRAQRLFREALAKLSETGDLIRNSQDLSQKDDLMRILETKIAEVKRLLKAEDAIAPVAPISTEQTELKNNLSKTPSQPSSTESLFQKAEGYVGVGQFAKAVKMFSRLLAHKEYRVKAAKEILACHQAIVTRHLPETHFRKWVAKELFSTEERSEIEAYLRQITAVDDPAGLETEPPVASALSHRGDSGEHVEPAAKPVNVVPFPPRPSSSSPQNETPEASQVETPQPSHEIEATQSETGELSHSSVAPASDSPKEFPEGQDTLKEQDTTVSSVGVADEAADGPARASLPSGSIPDHGDVIPDDATAGDAARLDGVDPGSDDYTEVIDTVSSQQSAKRDSMEDPDEDYVDIINSVTIPTAEGQKVSFKVIRQQHTELQLIIPVEQEEFVKGLGTGNELKPLDFNSLISTFRGSGTVSAVHQLDSGPHAGSYLLELVMIDH